MHLGSLSVLWWALSLESKAYHLHEVSSMKHITRSSREVTGLKTPHWMLASNLKVEEKILPEAVRILYICNLNMSAHLNWKALYVQPLMSQLTLHFLIFFKSWHQSKLSPHSCLLSLLSSSLFFIRWVKSPPLALPPGSSSCPPQRASASQKRRGARAAALVAGEPAVLHRAPEQTRFSLCSGSFLPSVPCLDPSVWGSWCDQENPLQARGHIKSLNVFWLHLE